MYLMVWYAVFCLCFVLTSVAYVRVGFLSLSAVARRCNGANLYNKNGLLASPFQIKIIANYKNGL